MMSTQVFKNLSIRKCICSNDDKDRIAYVELFEVFPKTISAVSYSNDAENQIQKISVSLALETGLTLQWTEMVVILLVVHIRNLRIGGKKGLSEKF